MIYVDLYYDKMYRDINIIDKRPGTFNEKSRFVNNFDKELWNTGQMLTLTYLNGMKNLTCNIIYLFIYRLMFNVLYTSINTV